MLTIKNRHEMNAELLHNLGYGNGCQPSARIDSLVNDYLENVHYLTEPSYSYVIKDIMLVHGTSVIVDSSLIFQSEVIARLLEKCDKVAIFLVTINKHVEEMSCRLAEDGLVLGAMVLDAIGSTIAEKVADLVQEKIARVSSTLGCNTSRRFSPGYCDWDISQQEIIFRAIDSKSVGIQLTDECLMLPRKSISGIIGIGTDSHVKNYNPCLRCDKENCTGRR